MGFDHRRLKHGFQSTEINFEFRVSLAINLVMAASRAAVTTCIDYDNDKTVSADVRSHPYKNLFLIAKIPILLRTSRLTSCATSQRQWPCDLLFGVLNCRCDRRLRDYVINDWFMTVMAPRDLGRGASSSLTSVLATAGTVSVRWTVWLFSSWRHREAISVRRT